MMYPWHVVVFLSYFFSIFVLYTVCNFYRFLFVKLCISSSLVKFNLDNLEDDSIENKEDGHMEENDNVTHKGKADVALSCWAKWNYSRYLIFFLLRQSVANSLL